MTQPLVDSGEFRRIGERAVPWTAFVVSVRNDVLETCGDDVRNVLDIVAGYAQRLKTGADSAHRVSETYGIEPDLMTFAKAVTNGYQPLGGVMVSDKIADVLLAHEGEFAHGLTYSGHPAAAADQPLLDRRYVLHGQLDPQITASHHDPVYVIDDGINVLQGLRLFDLGDHLRLGGLS